MSIKSLSPLALLILLTAGCADEDLSPIVTQDNLLFGAFPRLVELRTGEFDLNNLSSSAYEMEVDFVDNANGEDVAEYRIYAAFDDRTIDSTGTDLSSDRVLFRTFTAADFRAGPNGNLGVDVIIPFQDVAAATGVDPSLIEAGDRFRISAEVEKEDGRVFSSTNSTPAITNAFGGIIDFNVTATCPLPDDQFVGDYRVTYADVYDEFALFGAPVQALGNPPLDLVVTLDLVAGSSTRRTYNVGTYLNPGYGFATGPSTLDFACDLVSSSAIDSGAGCGNGTLAAEQAARDPFNFDDDSSFTITFNDFASDGGCGVAQMPFTLVFTKM